MQLTGYFDKNKNPIRVKTVVKNESGMDLYVLFDRFLGYSLFDPIKKTSEKLNRHNAASLEIIEKKMSYELPY